MLRLGVSEYIRNTWYNIVVVLIMTAMLVTSVVFISNVDKQTRLYRLTSPYIDEDSIFLMSSREDVLSSLTQVEKIYITTSISGTLQYEEDVLLQNLIYTEEMMDYIRPRLDEGVQPDSVDKGDDIISVAISKNPYGIKVGDVITIKNIVVDGEWAEVKAYVSGIISEGQSVPALTLKSGPEENFESFFDVYSYEQLEQIITIIPEKELEKIDGNVQVRYDMGIVDFIDEITEEEREANLELVRKYETEAYNFPCVDTYPEPEQMIEWNEEIIGNELLKYIPLTIAVVVLIATCIAGIISIKTHRSARYYGILYTCGMHYSKAVLLTGMEMFVNCVISYVMCVGLLTLQNKIGIIGKINCEFSTMVVGFMVAVCVLIVLLSMFMARRCLKENTPVEILKNM